jgi:DNA-binding transcriptional ArsR family regulator
MMLETIWSALAEPSRRAVLDLLVQRPRTVNEVVDALGLAQPTVSKHLKVLREAGLVRVSADAQRRIYAIEPAPLAALDDWLAPYRLLWNDGLDALGRHLDANPDSATP